MQTVKIRPGWSLPPQSLTCPRLSVGAKPARQNVSHTLVHQHQTVPAACFTVRCVRGEDLVDCVMIGAGRLQLAIIAQTIALLQLLCATLQLAFCSTAVFLVGVGMIAMHMVWFCMVCSVWHSMVGMIALLSVEPSPVSPPLPPKMTTVMLIQK